MKMESVAQSMTTTKKMEFHPPTTLNMQTYNTEWLCVTTAQLKSKSEPVSR